MKIIVGDLWNHPKACKIIPVNLSTNHAGHAILGKGVAKQAAMKYPSLPSLYGTYLKSRQPNQSAVMFDETAELLLVPVKRHWSDKAQLDLIETSLLEVINMGAFGNIYTPLLGCGFGELEILPVLTLMAKLLDNRFTLVLKDDSVEQKYPQSFKPGARTDHTTRRN